MSVRARIQRVRDLMKKRGYDAFVVRENSSLRWLTGARGVFDSEQAHTAFITSTQASLHTDSRYANSFAEQLEEDTPWVVDQERIAHPAWVAEHAACVGAHVVAVEGSMQLSFFRLLERSAEDAAIILSFPITHGDVTRLRAIKDDEEIALMMKAQEITDAAFSHITGFVRPGMTEMQIRVELDRFMYEAGADSLSFPSIVAAGSNSANPHAVPGERVIEDGDFLLFDYGAGYADYSSDMTRTVAIGEPAAWQREIYEVVLEAHLACAAMIAPGVLASDVHEEAVRIISEAGYGEYFQHALGHGVGIDIHEQPNLSPSNAKPLEIGNVVTVEPGIYLPGRGGVRVEDFGVVTQDGFSPFTTSPHELQVL